VEDKIEGPPSTVKGTEGQKQKKKTRMMNKIQEERRKKERKENAARIFVANTWKKGRGRGGKNIQ